MVEQPGVLRVLGLDGPAERVYYSLLDEPGLTSTEIAKVTGLARQRVIEATSALEDAGLVSRSLEKTPRFRPSSPKLAIDALIARRQVEMEAARAHGADLQGRFDREQPEHMSPAELVEIVHGRDAVGQRLLQVQRSAKEEVLSLSTPPYAVGPNPAEMEALERSVSFRFIYDRAGLEYHPFEHLRAYLEAGEQARVIPKVPMKLLIADRRIGIVPLSIADPNVEHALVLRASSLLDAFLVLFEDLWDRAVPLRLTEREFSETSFERSLSKDERDLLALLSTGLTDSSIAARLGLGLRTVRRRVGQLMTELEATSRFQAGVQAVRRGWM